MQFPILQRLDPKTIFHYVCENDNGGSSTIFKIRPLTVYEFKSCEEPSPENNSTQKIGEFSLKVLNFGLVGWDNFSYEDTGEIIPFSVYNIGCIPYENQIELFQRIMEISDVDENLTNELKYIAKWSDYLGKVKDPDQWDCDKCIKSKNTSIRNCDGTKPNTCMYCKKEVDALECPNCGKPTKHHFKFPFPDGSFVTRCPVTFLTPRALKLTNIINYVESSKTLPFNGGALEQTNFFYAARMIVLSEQNLMLKREMEKTSQQSHHTNTPPSRPPRKSIGRR